MKNEIIVSYRIIRLLNYLLGLYIAIKYSYNILIVIGYALVLIIVFEYILFIYLTIIYKVYGRSMNVEKNMNKVKEAACKIKHNHVSTYLKKLYCDLLEVSNHTKEYYSFFEENNDLIFGEKSYKFWYATKLLYYYNSQEYDKYLKLYDPKLDKKAKSFILRIIYYILKEDYEQALILANKVKNDQNTIGYVMYLYYKIICLDKLEIESELNESVIEILKYNDEIRYVKEIKEKYR